jgi:hypothetical protein
MGYFFILSSFHYSEYPMAEKRLVWSNLIQKIDALNRFDAGDSLQTIAKDSGVILSYSVNLSAG